jgi:hypothetical protein
MRYYPLWLKWEKFVFVSGGGGYVLTVKGLKTVTVDIFCVGEAS